MKVQNQTKIMITFQAESLQSLGYSRYASVESNVLTV